MFPDRIDSPIDCFSFPIDCYCVHVGLKGSSEHFVIEGSKELVIAMATNFIGKDPPFENDELADVFKEAGNVIVGNFLTILDVDSSISIAVPIVDTTQVFCATNTIPEREELLFRIESEFLRVTLLNN
jgi:CheY-specific phosphatase CheX